MTREPPATLESIIDQVGNQAAGRSDGCLCMASERALAAEIERLTEAHERIVEWSRAYPLTIFPEPDLKKAHALLEAGGMTLDAISAHAMRHVIEQVGEISRAALEHKL